MAFTPLPPLIISADLFRELGLHLRALLKGLSESDWHRPTVCSEWTVKDVAAHILDGNLRRLSAQRDRHRSPRAPEMFASDGELSEHLHDLNLTWTRAFDRVSPRILIELHEATGPAFAELMGSLPPGDTALHPVAWAGEAVSLNWFDVAQEYAENWLHQQHIRDALGMAASATMSRKLYHPVLDTFVRGLPYTYRKAKAADGTVVRYAIPGDAGGTWDLLRQGGKWILGKGAEEQPTSLVVVPQDVAWLIMTKKPSSPARQARLGSVKIGGHKELARVALELVSVMS